METNPIFYALQGEVFWHTALQESAPRQSPPTPLPPRGLFSYRPNPPGGPCCINFWFSSENRNPMRSLLFMNLSVHFLMHDSCQGQQIFPKFEESTSFGESAFDEKSVMQVSKQSAVTLKNIFINSFCCFFCISISRRALSAGLSWSMISLPLSLVDCGVRKLRSISSIT